MMNKTMYILCGISGSGKSTLAKKIADDSGAVIINRDKLREMLFGYTEDTVHNYYAENDLSKTEGLVSKAFDTLLSKFTDTTSVVIDNTNLSLKYLRPFLNLAKKQNMVLDIRLIEVDLDAAIERDLNRKRTVGLDIIKAQYNKFNQLSDILNDEGIEYSIVNG